MHFNLGLEEIERYGDMRRDVDAVACVRIPHSDSYEPGIDAGPGAGLGDSTTGGSGG